MLCKFVVTPSKHCQDLDSVLVWHLHHHFCLSIMVNSTIHGKIHLITFVKTGMEMCCSKFVGGVKFVGACRLAAEVKSHASFHLSMMHGIRGKKKDDNRSNGCEVFCSFQIFSFLLYSTNQWSKLSPEHFYDFPYYSVTKRCNDT